MIVAIVVLVISAIVLIKSKQKGKTEPTDYPYQKAEVLFSPAERSFLGVLDQAVGKDARTLGKVRVADVIVPRKGISRSDWQRAFNKISGKHFDYVLCKNDDLSVICAIELDDSSHQSKKRKKRDDFLSGACSAAGIPLVQVPAKSAYVIDEIRQLIMPHLGILKLEGSVASSSSQQKPAKQEKNCPKCASEMVIRVAKKGDNAGNQFWACSAYPKCRHTEAIKESA